MTIFNKSILIFLAMIASFAYAAPNIWEGGYATMGFSEYTLTNQKKQAIMIACNVSADGSMDHSFYYYPKGVDGSHVNPRNISVVFDKKITAYPPADDRLPTSTRGGANAWIKFTDGISKARTIDVYNNNKLVATFKPTSASVKTVAREIASCSPVGW